MSPGIWAKTLLKLQRWIIAEPSRVWQELWIGAQSCTKAAPAVPSEELTLGAAALQPRDAAFCSSSELELFSYTAPGCADCRPGAVLLGVSDPYLKGLVKQRKPQIHFFECRGFYRSALLLPCPPKCFCAVDVGVWMSLHQEQGIFTLIPAVCLLQNRQGFLFGVFFSHPSSLKLLSLPLVPTYPYFCYEIGRKDSLVPKSEGKKSSDILLCIWKLRTQKRSRLSDALEYTLKPAW